FPLSWVTETVYLNVAVPPAAIFCWVWSTLFVMPHLNVRVNEGVAVLLTVRSAPTHSWTEASAVWPVSLIVAVLGYVLQVPAVPVSVRVYVKVCDANGVESVAVRVPKVPL